MPTRRSISFARSMASALETFSWSSMDSAICSPTVRTGFSAVMGSWKIMATSLPRTASSSAVLKSKMLAPSRVMLPFLIFPGGLGTRFRIDSAVVVLPAPVSPTRPSVFFLPMLNVSPFTAQTQPSSVSKWTTRSLISSMFSAMVPTSYFFIFGSRASRSPSPSRFRARTVAMIARPGMTQM